MEPLAAGVAAGVPGRSGRASLRPWRSLALLLLAFLLAGLPLARAQVPVPPLKAAVTDLTATLSAQQAADLDARLQAWARQKGSQIAVLMVPTTQPEPIEAFSIRVAEAWKIGRKGTDDGAIIVVAKDDRTVRIEVGYGLEGAIPDAIAKRIVEEVIVPRFRAGDFYGGLSEAVTGIMKLVEGEQFAPPQAPRGGLSRPGSGLDLNLIMGLLVMLVFVNAMLGKVFGRVGGSLVGSGGAGVLVWLILGSLAGGILVAVLAFVMSLILGGPRGLYTAGPRHRGWGGGPWGGGGFGGGGFGGGFGGGGGGFGGGGASGRW